MQPDTPSTNSGSAYDVELRHVSKAFGGAAAIRELDLRVEHGIFFSLLGPSGCGKTTTLRLIAGFEQPTAGRVLIGGRDVAGLPPYRREVNTVFQSYALFPHMSVADNIAYGLRQRHVPRDEIRRRVGEALEMVRLPDAGPRRPLELSGGQQQRVALARALVNRPTVLLLDEPLSALDLKLRKEMQGELRALQRTVGITFIYVTHDQEEAITLSTRIGVMNAGRIEQEGTPEEVYERPRTRFVADFIGLTNFLDGTVTNVSGAGSAGSGNGSGGLVVVETALGHVLCLAEQPLPGRGERVTLTLRPEKLRVAPVGVVVADGWNTAEGVVTQATFLGSQNEYHVRVGPLQLVARQQNVGSMAGGASAQDSDSGGDFDWRVFGPGEQVQIAWRREASLILRALGADTREPEGAGAGTATPHASMV